MVFHFTSEGEFLAGGTIDLNELKSKYQKLQGLSLLFSLS